MPSWKKAQRNQALEQNTEREKEALKELTQRHKRTIDKIRGKWREQAAKEPPLLSKLGQSDTQTMHTVGVKKNGERIYSAERTKLHDDLVEEFLKKDGAIPVKDPEVSVLGGGPASGKKAARKAEQERYAIGTGKSKRYNAAVIDVDDIRAKFPEYTNIQTQQSDLIAKKAAEITHREASNLALRIVQEGQKRRLNIVVDGTGDGTYKELANKVRLYRKRGAKKVHANYVSIDTREAWARMIKRYRDPIKDGGRRWVPRKILYETHASVSRVLPEALDRGLFDSVRVWDNNKPFPIKAELIAVSKNGRRSGLTVAKGEDRAMYQRFLAKADEGLNDSTRTIHGGWIIDDAVLRKRGTRYGNQISTFYHDYIDEHLDEVTRKVLRNYTDNDFKFMNKMLREDPDLKGQQKYLTGEYSSSYKRIFGDVKRLQAFLTARNKPMPPPPDLVWRAIKLDAKGVVGIDPKTGKDIIKGHPLKNAKDGDIIRMDGFQSATTSPSVADDVTFLGKEDGIILEIMPREGVYVGDVSAIGREMEFLIPHGTRLRVIGKRKKVQYLDRGDRGTIEILQVEALPPT